MNWGEKRVTQLPELPESVQQHISEMTDYIVGATERFIKNLVWFIGVDTPYNPVRDRLPFVLFSFDSEALHTLDPQKWQPIGGSLQAKPVVVDKFNADDAFHQSLIAMIQQTKVQTPIAHELFREAWQQLSSNPRNRRSAVVIGVAAAETSIKRCITTLAPQTEWLLENVQSPRLDDLMRKYLPTLPSRRNGGKFLSPPSSVIKQINRGAEIRNKIVHTGEPTKIEDQAMLKDIEQLRELLLNIRDLLYILDSNCGFEWALQHVRQHVRDKCTEAS